MDNLISIIMDIIVGITILLSMLFVVILLNDKKHE